MRLPEGEVVVKPAVGAGSVGAQRFSDADAARAHAATLQAEGRTVLVQPYDPRVEDGETALVFLGGPPVACVHQGADPAAAGKRGRTFDESGTYAEESLTPAEPDFELWDVGHAALAAAAAHLDMDASELLYARVDVIGDRVGSAAARAGAGRAVAGLAPAGRRHTRPGSSASSR